ncbi:MAG TPA: formate dehydrogenase subunit delta [Steroidobacteraceae bacterium]|nr:formate dehydrogenase subunit delta [Steroidobacteraceae bacterium]
MKIEHLVKMANEIAAFYASDSPSDAPKNIASHFTRFWEPRMRKEIVEHNRKGGVGLKEAVRQAVELLAK